MEIKREETTKDEERKRKRDKTRNSYEVGWNVAYVDDWSGDEGASKKNNDENSQSQSNADQQKNSDINAPGDQEEEDSDDDDDDDSTNKERNIAYCFNKRPDNFINNLVPLQ
jgi:hypothetical protein